MPHRFTDPLTRDLVRPSLRRRVRGVSTAGVVVTAVACLSALGLSVAGASGGTNPPSGPTSKQTVPPLGAYWMVASDGGIFTFGGVPFEGSAGGVPLRQPVIGMAATPSSRGYWLAGADGGIFTYGDAQFHGSPAALPAAMRPTAPVVAISATPSGAGYWVVAANGSVYAFGDAPFLGSLGGLALAKPIVAMSATPDGHGYWLTASDGGVFAFGTARFAGSTGMIRLAQPIVGMAATADGGGYWLVASDGGIFSFGDARFMGSTGAEHLNQPIVGMAATLDGAGYWLVASDGGVFTFGDAQFRGSTGGRRINRPIVGMAPGITLNPYPPMGKGYDISFPQCGAPYPKPPYDLAIVGINDGKAFTYNPCLDSQAAWGEASVFSAYINLNAPTPGHRASLDGPAGHCGPSDTGCMAYNYGYNSALDSYAYGTAHGVNASVWWLDIETENTWDTNQFNNSRTIQGAIDGLAASGVLPGIYSTYLMFPSIAGSYAPGGPIWVPDGWPSKYSFTDYCTNPALGFAGGTPWLVQYQVDTVPFDQNYACPI
jgi:hypothetical protein